jgi:hypothetical protein
MKPVELQGNTAEERGTWLRKLLAEGVYDVTFTKVNGETRIMPCTLDPNKLPPAPVHITNTDNPIDFPKVKKQNPENLSVWCVDKNEWRSFKIMNVTEVKEL